MGRLRFSRIALTIILLLAGPDGLAGQGGAPEQGGGAFLLIPVGAAATALGQAAVADGGTTEALFWNPAGLAWLPKSEFAIHHATTFVSKNTALTAFVASDRLGVLGIGAYVVDFGAQEIVPPGAGPIATGRISPKNIELLASYATQAAGRLAVGVTYKLIQFRQDCEGDCGQLRSIVGTTHAVDIGLQLVLGETGRFRLGLALRHAGFKLQLENRDQADPLPTRVQFGVSYRVRLPNGGSPQPLDARILVDLQDKWGQYTSPDARIGLELGYGTLLRIRTGYAFLRSENSGPSIGIGLSLDRIAVDFARQFFASGTFDEPVYLSFRVLL